MYTAPNNEITDDLKAWETHIVRSHRRKTPVARKVMTFALAATVAAGALSGAHTATGAEPSEARVVPMAVAPLDMSTREAVNVSRSMERVALKRKASRKTRINRAIRFALNQRGERYRWGAAGPSRWDCSGLVMKSAKRGGKKLPHYTGAIVKKGKRVAKRSHLRRGDIVFPSRGHVGIYLGKGKFVHASSGQGKVVKSKLYGFYTARRIW
jgi:cell wall-associated NlpC family hydrolase